MVLLIDASHHQNTVRAQSQNGFETRIKEATHYRKSGHVFD